MIPYMQVPSEVWLQSRHFNNAVRAHWLPCGCGEGKKRGLLWDVQCCHVTAISTNRFAGLRSRFF